MALESFIIIVLVLLFSDHAIILLSLVSFMVR